MKPERRLTTAIGRQIWPLSLCWLLILLTGCSALNDLLGAPTLREARVEALNVDWRAPGWASEREPPLLRVVFSTNRDLTTYPRDHSSSIGVWSGLCHRGSTDPLRGVSGSGLLTETGEPIGSDRPTAPDAAGRYVYRFYLDIRSRAHDLRFGEALIDHDYRRDNDDICFYFRGGSMLVGTHRSPDFRIPYALIADALARAGMPHAPLTPGS